ncbi:MAG: hypothetical protein K2P64_00980 [Lachnospiraceae bacterium]|nr:hypothetical protein [Lachnospiraceae bacterium]MDE6949491.1 hypothetical protein [Lachnospiraceae bacterium]
MSIGKFPECAAISYIRPGYIQISVWGMGGGSDGGIDENKIQDDITACIIYGRACNKGS